MYAFTANQITLDDICTDTATNSIVYVTVHNQQFQAQYNPLNHAHDLDIQYDSDKHIHLNANQYDTIKKFMLNVIINDETKQRDSIIENQYS